MYRPTCFTRYVVRYRELETRCCPQHVRCRMYALHLYDTMHRPYFAAGYDMLCAANTLGQKRSHHDGLTVFGEQQLVYIQNP